MTESFFSKTKVPEEHMSSKDQKKKKKFPLSIKTMMRNFFGSFSITFKGGARHMKMQKLEFLGQNKKIFSEFLYVGNFSLFRKYKFLWESYFRGFLILRTRI